MKSDKSSGRYGAHPITVNQEKKEINLSPHPWFPKTEDLILKENSNILKLEQEN